MLLLCTANQCRSPMAEVLLRHRLAVAGVAAAVSSAGLLAGGSPATDHARAVMARRGLDLSDHRSRKVERFLVERADLVVGMAREHVREVVARDPDAFDRTFTLKELVRVGAASGPRPAGEPVPAWLGRVAGHRPYPMPLGIGHDDAYDIADPVGRSRRDYESTAAELDELLTQLIELVWPVGEHQERERSA